jgi:hypothetical protein
MPIPPTSILTGDDWSNIAKCASRRGDIARKEGDLARDDRESDWWAEIILMLSC